MRALQVIAVDVFLSGLMLLCPAKAPGQASFQGLGDLVGGTVESYARGISADGSVVVGTSSSARASKSTTFARPPRGSGERASPGGSPPTGGGHGAIRDLDLRESQATICSRHEEGSR